MSIIFLNLWICFGLLSSKSLILINKRLSLKNVIKINKQFKHEIVIYIFKKCSTLLAVISQCSQQWVSLYAYLHKLRSFLTIQFFFQSNSIPHFLCIYSCKKFMNTFFISSLVNESHCSVIVYLQSVHLYSRFGRWNVCRISVPNKLVTCWRLMCTCPGVTSGKAHGEDEMDFLSSCVRGCGAVWKGQGWLSASPRMVCFMQCCLLVCRLYLEGCLFIIMILEAFVCLFVVFFISPSHSLSPPDCIGIDCNLSKCSLFSYQKCFFL